MDTADSHVASLVGRPRSILAGTAHTEGPLCGAGNPEGQSMVRDEPPEAQAQASDPISCCCFLPGHFPVLCPFRGRRRVTLTWQSPVSGSQTSVWPWQLQRSQVPR